MSGADRSMLSRLPQGVAHRLPLLVVHLVPSPCLFGTFVLGDNISQPREYQLHPRKKDRDQQDQPHNGQPPALFLLLQMYPPRFYAVKYLFSAQRAVLGSI